MGMMYPKTETIFKNIMKQAKAFITVTLFWDGARAHKPSGIRIATAPISINLQLPIVSLILESGHGP